MKAIKKTKQMENKALGYAKEIVATVRQPLLVLDMNLMVITANKDFYRIFKVSPEETIGQFIYDLGNKQWNIPKLRRLLEDILPKRSKFEDFEVRHNFEDIGQKIMLLDARRIPQPPEKPQVILLAIEDITERKQMDKIKSEFIAIASHQLRTPLVGIRWVIERILKKEKLTIGLQGYLENISFSVQRLSGLVDDLLNTSRFEGGKLVISLKQIELVAFIKNYIAECQPLSIKRNLALTFEEFPETLNVITDPSILRNIVQSLVSNALEYTRGGGEVKVFLERKDGHFLLKVSDTGIGIPEKEQASLFRKFIRGSNAKLVKPSGSGLGLYLGKQAVDMLGGKIWFESQENKGTTFYVEFPLEAKPKNGSNSLT